MQRQHWNQYINIYLHRECCKTSFIYCFTVTAKNLIWLVFFLFSGSCWPTEELYLFAVLLISSNVPAISGLWHIVEIYKLSCIFEIVMNVKKTIILKLLPEISLFFVSYTMNFGVFMNMGLVGDTLYTKLWETIYLQTNK